MRKLAIIALVALAACSSPAAAPEPSGEFITATDPRDIEQCNAQPGLAWCKQACKVSDDGQEWCHG